MQDEKIHNIEIGNIEISPVASHSVSFQGAVFL